MATDGTGMAPSLPSRFHRLLDFALASHESAKIREGRA